MTIIISSGASLPAAYSCLKEGPLGPADGAAERAKLGRGAQGAVYASTAGLDVLVHVTQHQITGWDRSWSPRSRPVHQIRIRPSRWPREHPGPRGPTSRQQYAAGSAAPETTTILLDRLYDRNISNVRDGTGSEASPHGRTSLLASHGAAS